MARMPTRDDLPQAIASANTAVVRAPTNNVGASIAGFGDTLGGMARVLARAADEDKKKRNAMDEARADAFLQRALIEGKDNYNPQNKPDVYKWGGEYHKGATSWKAKAAGYFSDPNARELWMLKSDPLVARYTSSVGEAGKQIGDARTIAEVEASTDVYNNSIANTDNDDDAAFLAAQRSAVRQNLVNSGLMTETEASTKDLQDNYSNNAARLMRSAVNNPTATYGKMVNDPFRKFNTKLFGSEGGFSDPANARPREGGKPDGKLLSSALGYAQALHETWEEIRKANPDLELSPSYGKVDNPNDGRRNLEQNLKFMSVLTKRNADMLTERGIPVTEANLKLAHFMGKRVKAFLNADQGALASALFPTEAESNPDLYNGRTVGEVLAHLTAGFDNQPSAAVPDSLGPLKAGDRLQIMRLAEAGSKEEYTKLQEDEKNRQTIAFRDAAMSQMTLEESRDWISKQNMDPKVRLDVERLVDTEWSRRDQAKTKAVKQEYDTVMKAVLDGAANNMNEADLLEITKKMDDQGNRALIERYIKQGDPEKDDKQLENQISSLYLSPDPAKQKEFMDTDLSDIKFLLGFKKETRDKLFALQKAAKAGALPDGSSPVLMTNSDIKNTYPPQLGLKLTGADADPEDIAVWGVIEGQIQQRLEMFRQQNKREPVQSETQQIADETIIGWHQQMTVGGTWNPVTNLGLFGYEDTQFKDKDVSMAQAISDAYDKRPAKNKKPLSQMWRDFVAETEYWNRKNNTDFKPLPSTFLKDKLQK